MLVCDETEESLPGRFHGWGRNWGFETVRLSGCHLIQYSFDCLEMGYFNPFGLGSLVASTGPWLGEL